MNTENVRRLENLIRFGVISSVDHAKARCIVDFQGIISAPLPWLTLRAGTDTTWDSPSDGEQVLVLSPSGELSNGVVLFGMYSTAHPAPSNDPDLKIRKFSDDAHISYNTKTHHLEAILPDGATATINATGGTTWNGDITHNGNMQRNGSTSMTGNNTVGGSSLTLGSSHSQGMFTSDGDIKAGNISLSYHLTSGVQSGNGTSGVPIP